MTSSIDVKIANAKRRAEEEKAAMAKHGKPALPPIHQADVKMIQQDVAKALEAKKATAGTATPAAVNAAVRALLDAQPVAAGTAPPSLHAAPMVSPWPPGTFSKTKTDPCGWWADDPTRKAIEAFEDAVCQAIKSQVKTGTGMLSISTAHNPGSWDAWTAWAGLTAAPEPLPTAEQQAAFFGVSDAPKTKGWKRAPWPVGTYAVISADGTYSLHRIDNCQTTEG